MPNRAYKNIVFGEISRVGKALASPVRLELLQLLSQAPHTVEALADLTDQSVANTSHHLKVLRNARLVVGDRRGVQIWCSLAGDDVGQLWKLLRDVGRTRLAEVGRASKEMIDGDAVGVDELRRRLKKGAVMLVDVRPASEFYVGHIPGALSLPRDELEARLEELPVDMPTVAYCRGPLCTFAAEAVSVLRSRGYAAQRLDAGVLDWKGLGLPLEAS